MAIMNWPNLYYLDSGILHIPYGLVQHKCFTTNKYSTWTISFKSSHFQHPPCQLGILIVSEDHNTRSKSVYKPKPLSRTHLWPNNCPLFDTVLFILICMDNAPLILNMICGFNMALYEAAEHYSSDLRVQMYYKEHGFRKLIYRLTWSGQRTL